MTKKNSPFIVPPLRSRPDLLDKIDIKHTPDPPKIRRSYAPRSSTTNPKLKGVGVCEFIAQLLVLNERLPQKKKMTDAEIARQVITNYPKTKVAEHLKCKNKYSIQHYRQMFNAGRLTPKHKIPTQSSLRYDDEGKAILRKRAKRRNFKPSANAPSVQRYRPPTLVGRR